MRQDRVKCRQDARGRDTQLDIESGIDGKDGIRRTQAFHEGAEREASHKVAASTVTKHNDALRLCPKQSGVLQAPGVSIKALLRCARIGRLGRDTVVDGYNDSAFEILRQRRQVDAMGLCGGDLKMAASQCDHRRR